MSEAAPPAVGSLYVIAAPSGGGKTSLVRVLLEIDWQGAAQVRKLIASAVLIFILPPSLASLRERLEKRGQDAPGVIARRIEAAREEMRHCADFDYVIINQDFATAVDDLAA